MTKVAVNLEELIEIVSVLKKQLSAERERSAKLELKLKKAEKLIKSLQDMIFRKDELLDKYTPKKGSIFLKDDRGA